MKPHPYPLVVTDVRIRIQEKNGMKALCTIILNDAFAVNGIRIVENRSGQLMVAMPSRKLANGRYMDYANPTSKETRQKIEEAVLAAYEKETTLDDDFLASLDV